jgi:hypothetical protein
MPTLPGFNHAFESLHQPGPPEMTEWLRKGITFNPFSLKFMFTAMFPPARIIVCHSTVIVMKRICLTYHQPTDRTRAIACMHKYIRSIGQSVISQKKAEILSSSEIDSKGRVEKKNIQGRDLLSLLMKANMATDIPDHARMTDEDILARKSSSGYSGFGRNTDDDAFRRGSDLPACWT